MMAIRFSASTSLLIVTVLSYLKDNDLYSTLFTWVIFVIRPIRHSQEARMYYCKSELRL